MKGSSTFSEDQGLSSEVLSKLQSLVNLIRGECAINDLHGLIMEHLIDLFSPDISCFYIRDYSTQDYQGFKGSLRKYLRSNS